MYSRIAAFALLAALTSASVGAQDLERERSLDLTVGLAGVLRGPHRTVMGPSYDAQFTVPMRSRLRAGVALSLQHGWPHGDDCTFRIPGDLRSGCLTALPSVVSWSAQLGYDWQRGTRWAVRASAGPSLVRVYREGLLLAPDYRSTFGGLAGRIDLISLHSVNLIGSLRGTLVPAMPERARGTLSFGFGIGFH